MKVLFVLNNFYSQGNGLCGSARRTVKKLLDQGIEVKILSGANTDINGPQPDFSLKDLKIFGFQKLIRQHGYQFSKVDKNTIREAVSWADIIHVEEPFFVQVAACKVAEELNKPIVGTYHLHPENIFASLGLEKSSLCNLSLLKLWKKYVFDKCLILQCPTENVKERLIRRKFKSELRVISNGLVMEELLTKKDVESASKIGDAKYRIITIGRFAEEKDLSTLLNAMNYSKHSQEIRLIFAGQGPQKKKLVKLANKMVESGVIKYPPIFGFYSLRELQELSCSVDLYIHCAYIEVEGLSCMEAIQVGIVPIIAKGKHTATSQFALSENSVFEEKNAKDLAAKIDYWLDNDELRKIEAEKYIGLGNKYNIDNSIQEIIKMYNDAIELKARQK